MVLVMMLVPGGSGGGAGGVSGGCGGTGNTPPVSPAQGNTNGEPPIVGGSRGGAGGGRLQQVLEVQVASAGSTNYGGAWSNNKY